MDKVKIGVIGYGSLGKYIVKEILEGSLHETYQLVFVWNRTKEKLKELDGKYVLDDLSTVPSVSVDMLLEVCHGDIVAKHAKEWIQHAHVMMGSPTILANAEIESTLRRVAEDGVTGHSLLIPSGALWGAQDIQKMSMGGSLTGLQITMKKHPSSLKLVGELKDKLQQCPEGEEFIVYEGPVRELCPLAPNNVNTMAAASMAGACLGFDRTLALLVADTRLEEHTVVVDVYGKNGFHVQTVRHNPAAVGAVTGNATYKSFVYSLARARSHLTGGVHFI